MLGRVPGRSVPILEGSRMQAETPEEQIRLASSLAWDLGIPHFIETLGESEMNGILTDIHIISTA